MTAHVVVDLTESDLLLGMRNFEDHLVERKTVGDEKDWRKTAVAFANSAPLGVPAVLYIGVRNDGTIERPQKDLDEASKKFNRHMKSVYPRVAYISKIISENGLQALAVIIPGSSSRPHFAGLAYVRNGSETNEASEGQYAEMVAYRSSKAARILEWKGKEITVIQLREASAGLIRKAWSQTPLPIRVADCNQFYVTLQLGTGGQKMSFPLSQLEISFDNSAQRLQVEFHPTTPVRW